MSNKESMANVSLNGDKYEEQEVEEMKASDLPETNEDKSTDRKGLLTKILTQFEDHLSERTNHLLGFPCNLDFKHLMALSPFLGFLINNVGDPFKDSTYGVHSKEFEVAVLDWFRQLWGMEEDEHWGYVTNGGTEGNLQGLLLGRELLPNGILYTSRESHYSVFKIAKICRIDCKDIDTLITGEIDCNDLKKQLIINKDKPAIINVTIGTTFKGGVDNLDLVIKTLEECGFSEDDFYIHCDAALYGLISPFIENGPMFSFKKPIGSVCISGHKLLGSPIPCGVIITKKKYVMAVTKSIEYIDCLDNTISGSRNGHTSIFMWYTINMKGRLKMQQEVRLCLRNAQYLRNRLRNAGISSMLNERGIIVIFERPADREIIDHWQISCQGNMAHVVVMPHVTAKMLDDFVDDFVLKRNIWLQFGQIEPPCLAKDIGISNCACSIHGKGIKH